MYDSVMIEGLMCNLSTFSGRVSVRASEHHLHGPENGWQKSEEEMLHCVLVASSQNLGDVIFIFFKYLQNSKIQNSNQLLYILYDVSYSSKLVSYDAK